MSVNFGDSNINAEIGTPSLSADISRPSISVNFNAPAIRAGGGGNLLRELVNPQFFIGTVETLQPGEDVYCYLTGTKDAPVLNFGIPMGYTGDTGPAGQDGQDGADGAAATIAVGNVTTGLPTDPASVTNTGTSSAAVFDFVIPKGDKGDTGATGADGADGQNGADGADGVSPAVTITAIPGGNTVTITDADHPAGQSFNVMDGTDGAGVPSGGTTGQVLAKSSNSDYATTWADPGMVILPYGSSTWQNFLDAYNANKIVYCRASSNANPGTGTQGRMAFMAYINFSSSTPTSVEFQYYRSVSSHSDSQQGDQVFVYKLDNTSSWTVTTREAYTKIAAGTGLSSSYSSGTLTLSLASKALYFTSVACSATTGDFVSKSDASITADHVVAECVFANPSAITTNVSWTTAAGSVTLNGTCSTATTCNLVLVKKDN